MTSPYFAGNKPGAKPAPAKPAGPFGGLANLVSGAASEVKTAAKTAVTKVDQNPAAATRTIKVKAHTRTIKTQAPPANTQTVRQAPAQLSTVKRFAPHYKGEPVAGYGSSQLVTQPGRPAYRAARPFYTDAYTRQHSHGPAGQESTQWNAAQVAQAHRIQVANYGRPGYIARSLLPGGLDEGGIKGPGQALSRGANIASMVVPVGGEAAGILGFGLKGLRAARAAKDVAEVAPKAAETAGTIWYHGTSEANAAKIRKSGFINPTAGMGRATSEAHVFLARDPAEAAHYGKVVLPVREEDIPVTTGRPMSQRGATAAIRARVPVHPAEGPRSATVAEPGQAPTAIVRGALPGAKILRGKQEAGYSVERAKRFAAASVHLNNQALPPEVRIAKARAELRGELPKINFQGFNELNDESLQVLQKHILDHPHLSPAQKINATQALTNALVGQVPRRFEIQLFEHIFGKETAAGLDRFAKDPFRDVLANVLNIPRSLMASFDLSAPFRQGLMIATRHPTIFAKNFGPMIKSFGSEKVYHGMIDEIRARPTYPMMVEAKLPLTELGGDIGAREERFKSGYAETLTGGKYSPVRASGRAYTGFLDKVRADVFDHLIKKAQSQGENVQDQHFLESLGRYIGSATGRGELKYLKGAANELNAVFFSPRLMASRFNFLNPAYYARLHPFARKEALRSALQLAGTATTLVALASQIRGVKVETDPRNPDWGKIHIGNTRIDIGGGFQQPLRLLAQLATGVAISSTTGKSLSLTTGGYGKPTRLDIAERFLMGKESPIASLVTDWARGSTQIGQKFSWGSEAAQRMTPLLGQDALDIYKEQHGGMNGLMAALAGYAVGSVGIGTQTYGPAKPKVQAKAPADYFGGAGSGGGSPYFSSPSQSGGGGYFGP